MTRIIVLTQSESYIKAAIFVALNILLPQVFHLIPGGGIMFLPIYFFTLIAAQRYGYQVALLAAIMSPIVANLIFGSPVVGMIPDMLLKGSLLAFIGYHTFVRIKNKFLASLSAVIATWVTVGIVELPLTGVTYAFQDFCTGLPGMVMMIVGSWFVSYFVKK